MCHASTCLSQGAEAVLAEIEELVSVVGVKCNVRAGGCLGFCRSAPAAAVISTGANDLNPSDVYVRVQSLESSAKIVKHATGKLPSLDDAFTRGRLAGLREMRSRQHAARLCKWNASLKGLEETVMNKPELIGELKSLYAKAGFPHGERSTMMPTKIANYTQWLLESIEPITKHSAIFHFTSSNLARGTPHPRGRGKMPEVITWHTTLLAEVGYNVEGPLPWIERDYTPISSAKDWEKGKCDILIKIYEGGAATSWLHRTHAGVHVWLSKPVKTLSMPWLIHDGTPPKFRPSSVLMLLAGTGVVALPQVLAHRDPINELGIGTSSKDQLKVPIDVIYSCREDDVLLLPKIAKWCREYGEAENIASKGIRNFTLLLTRGCTATTPYPFTQGGNAQEAYSQLQELGNTHIFHEHLNANLISSALQCCPQPCRILVSGPASYNEAARSMLTSFVDVDEQVTILSA